MLVKQNPNRLSELKALIDPDFLKKATGEGVIPKDVLGIYRKDEEDWEGDEVSLFYIVYDDKVDLNNLEALPALNFKKIRQYLFDTIEDRFPRLKFINFSDLYSLLNI